jgi:hypothetical protein
MHWDITVKPDKDKTDYKARRRRHSASQPPAHRRFYTGLLGTSPSGVAMDLENRKQYRAAGILYALQGMKEDAGRCAGACMAAGRQVEAAQVYLTAGMPHEAIECARECKGADAFSAAKLFLDHSEIEAAGECAGQYLQGNDAKSIASEERAIIYRIFCRAGDRRADGFAPE